VPTPTELIVPDLSQPDAGWEREPAALLDSALAYGRAALRVFPCRSSDKRPLVRWSVHATSDASRITRLFAPHSNAVIGLCTGSGLVVVDDDRGVAEPDPSMAATLTARTRSRGYHHYFRTDARVPCSVGRVAPGVDVRGDGGYVIAPPSPGWEWINDAPMLELPPAILARAQQVTASSTLKRRGPFVEQARVSEGGRNDYMARYVGWLLRQDDEAGDIEALALQHNADVCVPPLPEDEVRRVVRSISRTHGRREASR